MTRVIQMLAAKWLVAEATSTPTGESVARIQWLSGKESVRDMKPGKKQSWPKGWRKNASALHS